ncbi:HTTM domain-containing protein [uncultured Aquimarina sp.]|uniref:HTTM domain-containing protein n=1 Tax=uncultured Aquimarina sp. TaxID=575652 RepID=UPI00261EEED0|nr:HTTM domain-containing protein [uncultured Aquimarina sp.]
MLKQLKHFLFKKVSPKGLALFRIAYSIVFLLEVITIFNYRQLYFDKLPYLNLHFPDTGMLLVFWMIVIVFLVFGLYTRIASIVNYIFTLVFISSAVSYEYHMFYVYSGMNFLLIFLPVHTSLSIDILRKKLMYIEKGLIYVQPKVSKLNYLVPVFIGLGLVYFDSVIMYKIESPMWLRGLGLWLPSSLPQITIANNQWLLNQEFLVKSLSYVTMAFEFMFVFLFWSKRFRLLLLIIGIVLHIGILLEYPIPFFGLGCMTIYLLMVPISIWDKLWDKVSAKKESLVIYYVSNSVSSYKFKIIVEFLDVFNRIRFINQSSMEKSYSVPVKISKGEVYGVDSNDLSYSGKLLFKKMIDIFPLYYIIVLYDKLMLYKNPIELSSVFENQSKKMLPFLENQDLNYQNRNAFRDTILVFFFFLSSLCQIQVHYSFFNENRITYSVNIFLLKHFGICKHPVFMDNHFAGYNIVYGLKYKNKFLPILDEKGMPDSYLSGGTWVNYMWRVNMPYVKENAYSLRKGFTDYSSFWAHRNSVDLSKNQEFTIVRKRIKVVFQWEEDLLRKNIESPWEVVGKLTWRNKKPQFFWNSINSNK